MAAQFLENKFVTILQLVQLTWKEGDINCLDKFKAKWVWVSILLLEPVMELWI